MNTRKITLAGLLSVLACSASFAAQGKEPLRYARVSVQDAKIRNLADDNGIPLLQPREGTILSVWRELAGWLEVEVPGGYLAWVHGRYLEPTEESDVYVVTRNAINIRPLPKSDVTSFPLPQRLHAGDRVLVVEREDPGVPISETWARILTPVGVHAWIPSSQTKVLTEGENGRALWDEALAAIAAGERTIETKQGTKVAPVGTPVKQVEAQPDAKLREQADQEARAELTRLRQAIDAERVREDAQGPDYVEIRRGLEALLASKPSSALSLELRGELERLRALEEVARVRAELRLERERREREVWERERGVQEASRAKDPLGAVFLSRGVLLRRIAADGTPRYHLRFGGTETCEVLCTSGRYALDLFAGYEVGVFGDELRQGGLGADQPVVDVRRLEVLKRR